MKLLRDVLGQPQLIGLLWKGEGEVGGKAMQVMESKSGPWRKEPRPLELWVGGRMLLKMTQREPWGQVGDKGE